MSPAPHLPLVDVAALVDPDAPPSDRAGAATAIDQACRDVGFFAITGHGVDPALQDRLELASRAFFERPEDEKAEIADFHSSSVVPAWRGWFPLGGELTSGVPDRKEGIYFGAEQRMITPGSPPGRCTGPPFSPTSSLELGPMVLEWLDAFPGVANA